MFGRRRKRIRAKEFVLEDAQGHERASLSVDDEDNAVLSFKDKLGQTRLFLGLTEDGTPRVSLQYAKGRGSIQLEANDALESAAIIITGPTGVAQVVLAIAQNGQPAIALLDEDGNLSFPNPSQATPDGGDDGPRGFDWDSILRR
ncbi:MAG: hypothetical protein GY851_28975 [bacterium]|nr:hypothetical protein [bacterium]